MLVIGGLVCFGLGIVARVAGSTQVLDTRSESEALQSELKLLNEQLSTKLAQLRTSLMQVHESVTSVAAKQLVQQQTQSDKSVPGDYSQDAIFRLAASLDKLHAHFDERVHAVDLQLRSGFENLLQMSQEVRRHIAQGGFANVAPSHAAPHATHGTAHHAPALGNETGIDFYQTMQKLDAIAGESGLPEPQPGRSPHPQAPFPSQGQGLDALLPEEYRDRY